MPSHLHARGKEAERHLQCRSQLTKKAEQSGGEAPVTVRVRFLLECLRVFTKGFTEISERGIEALKGLDDYSEEYKSYTNGYGKAVAPSAQLLADFRAACARAEWQRTGEAKSAVQHFFPEDNLAYQEEQERLKQLNNWLASHGSTVSKRSEPPFSVPSPSDFLASLSSYHASARSSLGRTTVQEALAQIHEGTLRPQFHQDLLLQLYPRHPPRRSKEAQRRPANSEVLCARLLTRRPCQSWFSVGFISCNDPRSQAAERLRDGRTRLKRKQGQPEQEDVMEWTRNASASARPRALLTRFPSPANPCRVSFPLFPGSRSGGKGGKRFWSFPAKARIERFPLLLSLQPIILPQGPRFCFALRTQRCACEFAGGSKPK